MQVEQKVSKESLESWHCKTKLPDKIPKGVYLKPEIKNYFYFTDDGKLFIARGIIQSKGYNLLEFSNAFPLQFDNYQFKETELSKLQLFARQYIMGRFIKNPYCDVFLQMNAGYGKTRLGISIASQVGFKTLVICPTTKIVDQWTEQCKELLPSTISVSSSIKTDANIIVSTIHMARKQNKSYFINNKIGLVIFDEVHEYATSVNSNLLWESSNVRYRLGLTATPENTTKGLLPYLEAHLGKCTSAMNLIPSDNINSKKFVVDVHIVPYYSKPHACIPELNDKGMLVYVDCLKKIIYQNERMQFVEDIIKTEYDLNRNILCFVEYREYVEQLCESLKRQNLSYYNDCLDIKGGVKDSDLETANTKRIIVTTYSYFSRGISYAHLDTIIFISPRKSNMVQITGRIMRLNSDNKINRKIIDIWDSNTILSKQKDERMQLYLNNNWNIISKSSI